MNEKRIQQTQWRLKRKKNTALVHNIQTSFRLLPTANAKIIVSMGQKQNVRLMLDSGSNGTLISELSINYLGLKRKNASYPVNGLANSKITITEGYAEIEIKSIYDSNIPTKAFILDKLTTAFPVEKIYERYFSHLKNTRLADPHFQIQNKIDIILGSDYFFSILLPGQIT